MAPKNSKSNPSASLRLLPLWCVLAALIAAPAWGQITCGPSDGPGKKLKHTVQDPNDPNKSVKYYCVDGHYFKIEVMCGATNTCFAKCVFDGGKNQPIPFPGPDGWPKWVWYNWDPATCNVSFSETRRRRGETAQQQADRVRQLLIDRGCDFNCYTWTRNQNLGPSLASKADESPEGSLFLEIFRGGDLVDSVEVPPEEIEFYFEGGYEYLIEDPAMHLPTSQGQTATLATGFIETFEDGVIESRYSALPGTDPLAIVDESLYFNIVESGDGLNIDTAGMDHPACLVLEGLDISPFSVGDGLGFLLEFDNGDSFDLQFYQMNSVRVKAVEKKNDGTQTEIVRNIDGIDLDDIDRVQIDWVPSPGTLLERIEVEIWTKDGRKIVKKFRSGLTHESGRTTAYRIRGLDISTDPPILVDTISYSDEHTDYVDGFVGDLTVADLSFSSVPTTVPIGQPGTITLSALNAAGDPLPTREVVLTASGGIAFNNPYGLVSEDGLDVTLTTDDEGTVSASFVGVEGGPVTVAVSAEGDEAVGTVTFQVRRVLVKPTTTEP